MRIVKKGVMPDGTAIQLEDWSEDYSFYAPVSHLAAYPIAKKTLPRVPGWCYPEYDKKFRLCFCFGPETSAELAFLALQSGEKQLMDYAEYMDDKELAQCL